MRYIRIILNLLVISYLPALAQSTDCFNLVWADEFEVSGNPDPLQWNFETGGGGWGNNELQTYTSNSENSYVTNGTLKIVARKSESGQWTSARMVTSGKASWKYGKMEIRAKLPLGRGTWPALWMMPQYSGYGTWPKSGEIDIMEHVGYDPGKVYGTVHTEAYNHKLGTQKGGNTAVSNVHSEFHTYAIEWADDFIKWFVDGNHYFTFINENKSYREWPFDQPFFMILNVAIGGDWGGAQGIDPALTEATMEIDYVRIYSKSLEKPVISGPSAVSSGEQVTFTTKAYQNIVYQWNWPEGVTMLSGEGTNSLNVAWNNLPGNLKVKIISPCDTVESDPLNISVLSNPGGEYLDIPLVDSSEKILWSVWPGTGNTINLRHENGELVVSFNIIDPLQNPYIFIDLSYIYNLTRHKEMLVDLLATSGSGPSNLRFDLLDNKLQNDLNDLFKIASVTADGQYHSYNNLFSMNTGTGYNPDKIKQIRLYLNYGLLGKKGSGEFRLKNLKMRNPNYTFIRLTEKKSDLNIFPNPSDNFINIRSDKPFSEIRITELNGKILKLISGNPENSVQVYVSFLPSGNYLVTVSEQGKWAETIKLIKK